MSRKTLNDSPRFIWSVQNVFLITLHLAVPIAVAWYIGQNGLSMQLVGMTVILGLCTMIGITAGYHRYYAHNAYKLARAAEAVMLFLGTLALQGSVVQWSWEHRRHHRFVDTDGDPYNVLKGFWHAHILWIFGKRSPIDHREVKDLLANPLVRFQHTHYPVLAMVSNILVGLGVGLWQGDVLGAFIICVGLRLLLTYHATWCINSAAHYWGSRSYSLEQTARDNFWIALVTVGEGYHNTHHCSPADYRNGTEWWQPDPGKWVIWTLSKLGLAWDLKRQPKHKLLRLAVIGDERQLLEKVRNTAQHTPSLRERIEERFGSLASMEQRIADLSGSLHRRFDEMAELLREKRTASRSVRRDISKRLRALQNAHRIEWAAWCQICALVLEARLR